MEEPLNNFTPQQDAATGATPGVALPDYHAREAGRANLLRRLRILMATGATAFVLTTWLLVRIENPGSLLPWGQGPSRVVRAHLAALNRGDFRGAYEQFSRHYREQIPFPAYQHMVAVHRAMFRTREVEFSATQSDAGRAVFDTRLVSADGERYLVRFTLVESEGRWWIDSIRWSEAPNPRNSIRI